MCRFNLLFVPLGGIRSPTCILIGWALEMDPDLGGRIGQPERSSLSCTTTFSLMVGQLRHFSWKCISLLQNRTHLVPLLPPIYFPRITTHSAIPGTYVRPALRSYPIPHCERWHSIVCLPFQTTMNSAPDNRGSIRTRKPRFLQEDVRMRSVSLCTVYRI
jgi:hypothetical protein